MVELPSPGAKRITWGTLSQYGDKMAEVSIQRYPCCDGHRVTSVDYEKRDELGRIEVTTLEQHAAGCKRAPLQMPCKSLVVRT